MAYGSALYGISTYESAEISGDSFEENAEDRTQAISFPFRFTAQADLALVPAEVGVKDDVVSAVFVSRFGIPLFPIGVGIEDYIFEPMNTADQAFLSDQIEEAIRFGVPNARVLQNDIQFDNSRIAESKVGVIIPYSNLKTGKSQIAILAVPREGIDR